MVTQDGMLSVHINELDLGVIRHYVALLHALLRIVGVPNVKAVLGLKFFFVVELKLKLMVAIPRHTNQAVIS